jgi:hypothetical protein
MRQKLAALVAATAVLAPLGGCVTSGSATNPSAATGTPAEQRALARYSAYAGPPIPSFTWFGRFYSFEVLGRDRVVVFTTPSDAYLLKVEPQAGCDFRFVINAIGITSTASTIYAHTDSLTINSAETGPGRWLCPIEEIRRIDYKRMRADQRAQARNPTAPPNAAPTPPPNYQAPPPNYQAPPPNTQPPPPANAPPSPPQPQ